MQCARAALGLSTAKGVTKFFSICVSMAAYHWTKNFEIFETGTNGTEISREKFSEIWVCLMRLSSFTEFMQIPNFLVLSAS